jgi:hypothetical protein
MKKDITNLFCFVDDFVQGMSQEWKAYLLEQAGQPIRKPTRIPELTESEMMTIILMFQTSPCRNFKYFYTSYLQLYAGEFPKLTSYERFVSLKPRVLCLLVLLLFVLLTPGKRIAFIDSTSLAVCHCKRIYGHKVFKGLASRGKTTKGWFFGFKLHVIVDAQGNLMRVKLTEGSTDDRKVVDEMTQNLSGLLVADKGYIDKKLFLRLFKRGIKLVTGIKKNMKNMLMPLHEKLLLRKRSLIETVFDYLKNKLQLEHTRHRSHWNACIHIVSTLIVYQMKPTKPSISFNEALPDNP